MVRPNSIGLLTNFRSSIARQTSFFQRRVVCRIRRPGPSYCQSTRRQDAAGVSHRLSAFANRLSAPQVESHRPSLETLPSAAWVNVSGVLDANTWPLMLLTTD